MTDFDQEADSDEEDVDVEQADAYEPSDGDGDGPARRRWWPVAALVAVVIVVLGVGLGLLLSGGSSSAATGPEGVPIQNVPDLAAQSTTATGMPIDGITCRTSAQQSVKYHIHAHVDIFVNGQQERIPAGTGIPGPISEHLTNGVFDDNRVPNGCLYWLHVHANDGVVHVESPYKHTFTLGQFFDIWQQPLGPNQVGPARGTVVAFVNGKRFAGNPRDVPLLPHAVIQLDVGSPVVPFHPVSFKVKGLCGAGTLTCATPSG